MLKHVHLSPYRSSMISHSGRADTMSLNSTMSCSSLSQDPLSSRSSSYTSLNESQSPTVSSLNSTPLSTINLYNVCQRFFRGRASERGAIVSMAATRKKTKVVRPMRVREWLLLEL